ncbi:MAG: sulfotransferase [Pseudomonas sp.]
MTLAAAEMAYPDQTGEMIAAHESMLRQPGLAAPQAAAVWRQLARLLISQNASDRAIEALLEAATLEPEHAETYFDLGNLLFRTGNVAASLTAFRHAAGLAPQNAAVWHNFGNALAATNSVDAAIACLDEAVRLDPSSTGYLRSKAVYLLQAGRKVEAQEAFSRLATLEPRNATAHLNLVGLKHMAAGDPQIAALEQGFADVSLSADERAAFGFALFKACDDLGQHERAFATLVEANRLKRATFTYEADLEARSFEDMKRFFTDAFLAEHATSGYDGAAPIFIVGMPRSGTTLTEQILSSHSMVAAGGESFAMTDIVTAAFANDAEARLVLSEQGFAGDRAASLGRAYAERMRRVALDKPRFTDKMPLNFRWVGFIATLLPQARFVHCTRDPLATCFSVFSSYFYSSGNRYAYDRSELVAFYRQYKSLMAHWHRVMPGRVLDVSLEDMTRDQEGQTRRLLDHCGLEFEPACLDFHRNGNLVNTLSAMQVRRPIFSGQDEKMRPYLPFLAGIQQQLTGAE